MTTFGASELGNIASFTRSRMRNCWCWLSAWPIEKTCTGENNANRNGGVGKPEIPAKPGTTDSIAQKAPPGFEPGVADLQSAAGASKTPTIHGISAPDEKPLTAVLTGAGANPCDPMRVDDPDLARVIEAWTTLPDPIRRAVMALIGTAPATKKAGKPSRRKRS
jgi:hypothetical protein